MSFVRELKRRNVFRVGVAYVIIAWLLLQVSDTLVPALRLPEWFQSGVALLLILGFPLALFFAWAFELTPDGLKKEKDIERSESSAPVTGRKLDFIIIGLLVASLGVFGYDKFVLDPGREAAEIEAAVQVATEQVADPVDRQNFTKSIAVLAFDNMSDDADNEYFSDGISEEILNLLTKVSQLRVTSRSSAFSFKGQKLDVPTMAARLKVAYVLEGSVRKSGNRIRITAQLIDGVTDTHVWSESYDRELQDVFAVQDEIAAMVVDALKVTLLGDVPKTTETNPEAYALYLQAVFLQSQFTLAGNQQAETLLTQALEIDPNYAPAWAQLGSVFSSQAFRYAVRPVDEADELARNAIRTALELDPQNGRAYATLGDIEIHFAWNFTTAANYMQQALKLNSGDVYILSQAAHLENILGRTDEAIELSRQIIVLDPLVPAGHNGLGGTYYLTHRLEEAAGSLRLGQSLAQGQSLGQYRLSMVLLAQGDARAALAEAEQQNSGGSLLYEVAIIQYALGDTKASDAAIEELITNWSVQWAYQIAHVHAYRGEIDEAFEWLNIAYENRDTGLAFMLLEPLLGNLHDDPRWGPFLDNMGLPH